MSMAVCFARPWYKTDCVCCRLTKEPHTGKTSLDALSKANETAVQLKLHFFGHYNEPNCTVWFACVWP